MLVLQGQVVSHSAGRDTRLLPQSSAIESVLDRRRRHELIGAHFERGLVRCLYALLGKVQVLSHGSVSEVLWRRDLVETCEFMGIASLDYCQFMLSRVGLCRSFIGYSLLLSIVCEFHFLFCVDFKIYYRFTTEFN